MGEIQRRFEELGKKIDAFYKKTEPFLAVLAVAEFKWKETKQRFRLFWRKVVEIVTLRRLRRRFDERKKQLHDDSAEALFLALENSRLSKRLERKLDDWGAKLPAILDYEFLSGDRRALKSFVIERIALVLFSEGVFTNLDETIQELIADKDRFVSFRKARNDVWYNPRNVLVARVHREFIKHGIDFPLLPAIRLVAQTPTSRKPKDVGSDLATFCEKLRTGPSTFERFFLANFRPVLETHMSLDRSPLRPFDVERHVEIVAKLVRGHKEAVTASAKPVPLDEVYGGFLISVLAAGKKYGRSFDETVHVPRIALDLLSQGDAGNFFSQKTTNGIRAWNQFTAGNLPFTPFITPFIDPSRPVFLDVLAFLRDYEQWQAQHREFQERAFEEFRKGSHRTALSDLFCDQQNLTLDDWRKTWDKEWRAFYELDHNIDICYNKKYLTCSFG